MSSLFEKQSHHVDIVELNINNKEKNGLIIKGFSNGFVKNGV